MDRRLAVCLVCWIVAPLAGCGKTAEADLESPVYVLDHENGPCGGNRAVDGKRGLWTEGGCEGSSGFSFGRTISAEQWSRLEAAFRAHPDPATFHSQDCDLEEAAGNFTVFRERRADGTVRNWQICFAQEVLDSYDPSFYPAPFSETVSAFTE
jgi:hypothetical protein